MGVSSEKQYFTVNLLSSWITAWLVRRSSPVREDSFGPRKPPWTTEQAEETLWSEGWQHCNPAPGFNDRNVWHFSVSSGLFLRVGRKCMYSFSRCFYSKQHTIEAAGSAGFWTKWGRRVLFKGQVAKSLCQPQDLIQWPSGDLHGSWTHRATYHPN